jgi:hypothetical protein
MERTETMNVNGSGSLNIKNVRLDEDGTYHGFQHVGSLYLGSNTLDHDNGFFYPSTEPAIDGWESILAQAITDCWDSVRLTEDMLLAQAGELQKSLGFLISTFSRAFKIFKALKRFDLRYLKREIHYAELAKRYLEARYAVRPLMYDTKQTLEAIFAPVVAKYQTYRKFRSAQASLSGSCTIFDNFPYWRAYGSYRSERTVRLRVGVFATTTSFANSNFSIWGIGDIFQSTWELVPFSFIIDWFLNVGKIIGSWAPKVGLKPLASWYTVEDTVRHTMTAETGESFLGASYPHIHYASLTGEYSRVIRRNYRVPNPDRPILPSILLRMDGWKTLDLALIVAAIAGLFTKGKTSRGTNNLGYAWFDGDTLVR